MNEVLTIAKNLLIHHFTEYDIVTVEFLKINIYKHEEEILREDNIFAKYKFRISKLPEHSEAGLPNKYEGELNIPLTNKDILKVSMNYSEIKDE